MHPEVILIGGLSFLWFALSNATLMEGDSIDFG